MPRPSAPVSVVAIPVALRPHRLGSVLIIASDEIDEIWSAALTQAVAGGALALAVLFASSLFIRRASRPLDLAGTVLARLQVNRTDRSFG